MPSIPEARDSDDCQASAALPWHLLMPGNHRCLWPLGLRAWSTNVCLCLADKFALIRTKLSAVHPDMSASSQTKLVGQAETDICRPCGSLDSLECRPLLISTKGPLARPVAEGVSCLLSSTAVTKLSAVHPDMSASSQTKLVGQAETDICRPCPQSQRPFQHCRGIC
jgi:hypothetical protein